jgi:hypothetical protein
MRLCLFGQRKQNPTLEKIIQPVPIPPVSGPLIPRPSALESLLNPITLGGTKFTPLLGYSGQGKTTLMCILLNSLFFHQGQPCTVVACHVDFRGIASGADPMTALTNAVGGLRGLPCKLLEAFGFEMRIL